MKILLQKQNKLVWSRLPMKVRVKYIDVPECLEFDLEFVVILIADGKPSESI